MGAGVPGDSGKEGAMTLQRLTEQNIGEEQGGLRKGRGWVKQIFLSFRRILEKILAKGRNCTLPSWIQVKFMSRLAGMLDLGTC